MEETIQTQEVAQEQPIAEISEIPAETIEKPVDKLYQLAIRRNGVDRMVTVIAEDVREAINKVAEQITAAEHVFEAKYVNEVHVK